MQMHSAARRLQSLAETRKKRGAALDLPTVMQACPEFCTWARSIGGYL
jgi:replication initiation protein RepC